MTINKLLLGVVLIGMLACYGCHEEPEPEEMLVCSDADAPIVLEGESAINEDVTGNRLTGDFMLAVAGGLLDGEYWNPGDNHFELEKTLGSSKWPYSMYWNDADITVYGGSGTVDTVAFVGTSKTMGSYLDTLFAENLYFKKDTTIGVGSNYVLIAYTSFTDTVAYGDNVIIDWIIYFDSLVQPIGGGFYLTDTIGYTLAEGVAQNTGIPYIHKLRFIYRGATNDTNLISISKDSIWYDGDTSDAKVFVWASDSARDGTANDSIVFVDMLDSYGRLWKRDSVMQLVPANQYVTGRPNLLIKRIIPAGGPF